jgi:hypothetical protein
MSEDECEYIVHVHATWDDTIPYGQLKLYVINNDPVNTSVESQQLENQLICMLEIDNYIVHTISVALPRTVHGPVYAKHGAPDRSKEIQQKPGNINGNIQKRIIIQQAQVGWCVWEIFKGSFIPILHKPLSLSSYHSVIIASSAAFKKQSIEGC